MITEYEIEPIRGLPGLLPKNERILWQGSPDWRVLARTAFHTRLIVGYFAVLVLAAVIGAVLQGSVGLPGLTGIAITLALGAVAAGLVHLLAWLSARSTVYTLTDKRVVLRIGIALPKCINLPLGLISSIDLHLRADGSGDVPLKVEGAQRLGYAALWPHARPWHLRDPQPMLRAIADGERVAGLIARTCYAANPQGRIAPIMTPQRAEPSFGEAAAA